MTSSVGSDETFITPVSSSGDLMALSPNGKLGCSERMDTTSDLLTGDFTPEETFYDGMIMDGNNLDYLDKLANRHPNLIDLGKESLFVKFDPLYAKQLLSKNLESTLQDIEKPETDIGYETSSATSVLTEYISQSPKQACGGSVVPKCGKEKPTQVVTPVVSLSFPETSTPAPKPAVLVRSASVIVTSGPVATDRLISISGNTPPTAAPRSPRNKPHRAQEVDRLQSLKTILQNQDQENLQLRQEIRELKSALQDAQHTSSQDKEAYENKIKKLTDERDTILDRECRLEQQLNDKTLRNKQMSIVMEEYEGTIISLIEDQQKLQLENTQLTNHLANLESSFNDLLTKYEKAKHVIFEGKDRENTLTQAIAENQVGFKKYANLYNELKQVTAEKLQNANETLDNLKKSHAVEITKLNAAIKKHEIMISSLQETLAQKTRDNEELTRICDQLINGVR